MLYDVVACVGALQSRCGAGSAAATRVQCKALQVGGCVGSAPAHSPPSFPALPRSYAMLAAAPNATAPGANIIDS